MCCSTQVEFGNAEELERKERKSEYKEALQARNSDADLAGNEVAVHHHHHAHTIMSAQAMIEARAVGFHKQEVRDPTANVDSFQQSDALIASTMQAIMVGCRRLIKSATSSDTRMRCVARDACSKQRERE